NRVMFKPKTKISWDWPVEEGHYLTANPLSPVALVMILAKDYDRIPRETEDLVRCGVEKGVAISGTLQTANIGIEKIILNLISNPNIRWLILAGKPQGHRPEDALRALFKNGIDEKNFIKGTKALTAILKNIPVECVERFRKQVSLIDLVGVIQKELVEKAIWGCFQEKETSIKISDEAFKLFDPGSYPEPPIIKRITDKLRGEKGVEKT
ncbi:MAG: hypothetical protein Q8N71_04650, partial [candidate division Zixibacteria bacterium]|nr:hypothetical protein [candidate division Zixibacteria bacterium]